MVSKRIYFMLLSVSFLWLAESEHKDTFYNKSGLTKVNLINSDIYNTSLEVVLEGYDFVEITEKPGYYKISCDKGTPILNKGLPNLPKINTSIVVPDNSNMEVSVIDYEYEDIYNINIIPSKGNFTRDIDPSTVPYSFDNTYKKDKFYPGELVEMGEPYILRDLRGQGVIIYPFQYNPFTKVLRIYTNMTLDIKSTGLTLNEKNYFSRESNNVIKQSNEFKNIYDNLFINYNNDTRFEYIEDVGNMLIIAYDDFMDEMEPFVTWKNKKGIPTELVSLNSIGNSVVDIQTFVNNYYYDTGLTYLLLVGDIAQMPTHIVGGSASDPTFGFIEGDDAFSEIIIGRFSANNPSELITQVERSIQYEQDPSTNVNHFNQALGIASTQGPGYGGLTDAQFNDLLWNDFLSEFTYDGFNGLYDGSGSVSEGVAAINDGVGVINYTGHAGPTGWGNGAPLGVDDVNGLTNTNKLPFIFTVGCNPGQFNDFTECFCEAWMRATDADGNPTGAIGHLGSTISQSWEPPMHGQWAMNSILTESYEGNVSRSFGGIAINGCMHMNEAQGSSGINETKYWTLFGDPSLIVRTDEPVELDPSYDSIILVGQTEFIVDVGVEGALVAISLNGELLSSSSSIGGVAILDVTEISNTPGQIDIVITSFNAYTHEDSITIITPDGAHLIYNDYELVNSNGNEPIIQYGGLFELNLLVENVGTINTSAINVTVTSDDDYITVVDGESSIAYAILNQIAITENPISFSVSNSVPDGHFSSFDVLLDNGEENWNFNFSVEVHAPVFEVLNPVFIDADENNVWDPGETATINVDLVNSGSASYGWYPGAIITTENPYINILSSDSDNTFYGIPGNTTYQGSFMVEAIESAPLNTEVDFTISWGYSTTAPCESDDCIEQANFTYSAIIGHPSIIVWDPSNQHISGERLLNYFEQNNITGFDYIDTTVLPVIENYQTAFILLGVYPENHYLLEEEIGDFITLLESGGSIYMEGGDTWAFDSPTSLQSMFGLIGEADGSADLSSLSGVQGTFAENIIFSYNGGNSFVDRLLPVEGFSLLKNDDPLYITSVAYENEQYGYRTIGSSHDLGGLQGDDFNLYMNNIFEFLSLGTGNVEPECSIGDINQDQNIDVTDIIRQVNIIINFGDIATEYEMCASDITGDGLVNVLDVLALVNIIIDDNRRSYIRSNPIHEVNVIIEDKSLLLSTEGILRGVQCKIRSEADYLELNNDINMDIGYNVSNGIHNIIIYNLQGNYMNAGDYTIFETNDKFEVLEFTAANVNNDAIEIFYENNLTPNQFVLKQNYPNPFNPTTQIDIELGFSETIKLIIFDINGRQVNELVNGFYNTGSYSFIWNGKDDYGYSVSSGMYIYSLISNDKISTKKMLLLK